MRNRLTAHEPTPLFTSSGLAADTWLMPVTGPTRLPLFGCDLYEPIGAVVELDEADPIDATWAMIDGWYSIIITSLPDDPKPVVARVVEADAA